MERDVALSTTVAAAGAIVREVRADHTTGADPDHGDNLARPGASW